MAFGNYIVLGPAGYQPISATSSTAVSITIAAASAASATRTDPTFALITPETSAIRWRDDGTAPTAAVSGGFPLAVGQTLEYDGPLRNIQFIAQAGTSTVNVALYRAY